jgi:signal transduction histidine kinase/ActR/RegA family two-component response regulator
MTSASHRASADRDLAKKGTAGSLLYLAIWLLILSATPIPEDSPRVAWTGTALLLLLGVVRLILSLRFDHLYPLDPVLWLKAYSGTVLGLGLVWGLLNALTVGVYTLGWPAYLSGFTTAGIVAGGTLGVSTHLSLLRAYVTLMLLPSIAVCLALGLSQTTVIGILFGLDLLFMIVIGKELHSQYWSALDNSRLLETRAKELDEARVKAESADRAKSQFVANMSHEIRTPMNGVLGMIEMLRQEAEPETRSRYLEIMEQSARSLLTVIDDILDVSKIEAGKLDIETIAMNPARVVSEVLDAFRQAAGAKGLTLVCEVSEELDRDVLGDPSRLRQILTNLLSNAIKFTTSGKVSVEARLNDGSDGSLHARFDVTDTGIGIPEHAAAQIFDAFVQGDGSITRRYGGTGLGLAISRQLAKLLGGSMGVESRLGEGSRFWFTATFARCHQCAEQNPGRDIARTALSPGLRVLVVEDNAVNQFVASEMLASLRCEAHVAENGQAALRAVKSKDFDVILMDREMPVMDGLRCTELIRKRELENNLPAVPIVAVTAHARQEDEELALRAGMNAFLSKPYGLEQLLEVLLRCTSPATSTSRGRQFISGRRDGTPGTVRTAIGSAPTAAGVDVPVADSSGRHG